MNHHSILKLLIQFSVELLTKRLKRESYHTPFSTHLCITQLNSNEPCLFIISNMFFSSFVIENYVLSSVNGFSIIPFICLFICLDGWFVGWLVSITTIALPILMDFVHFLGHKIHSLSLPIFPLYFK